MPQISEPETPQRRDSETPVSVPNVEPKAVTPVINVISDRQQPKSPPAVAKQPATSPPVDPPKIQQFGNEDNPNNPKPPVTPKSSVQENLDLLKNNNLEELRRRLQMHEKLQHIMNHHQNHHLKANVNLDDDKVKKVFLITLEMIQYQCLNEKKQMTSMVQRHVVKVKVQ